MFNISNILNTFLIPLEKYTTIQDVVYFCSGIWSMIKIQVFLYGIPQHILDYDKIFKSTEVKTIKLSRVPIVGEIVFWRNQSFRITKVIHYSEKNDCTARIEMEWSQDF